MEKWNDILIKVGILFRRYGIKSITMDDIAREVGISKKTLYQFVTEKSDLVNKMIDLELLHTKDCFEAVRSIGNNAIAELFEVNRFMIEMMKRNSPSFEYDLKKHYPEVHQKVLLTRRNGMYESVLANLKRGKAEGLYRAELNEKIITKLQISRFENMYNDVIFSGDEYSAETVFKEIFVYHIRGIANEEGIKILDENIHKFDYAEKDILRKSVDNSQEF
jgi:AcrR family transcriptional regulator